jgi:hypothetical protein
MFDTSIVYVRDQNLVDMEVLCAWMDVQYEYLYNLLFVQGFEDNVHHFLKGKHLVKYLFVPKKTREDLSSWHGT